MSSKVTLESSAPSWAREIDTLMPACSQFVVFGNVRDFYVTEADTAEVSIKSFVSVLGEVLRGRGVERAAFVAPHKNASGPTSDEDPWLEPSDHNVLRLKPVSVSLQTLGELASETLVTDEPRALIVLDASRVVADPARLSDEESALFRDIRRTAERQSRIINDNDDEIFSPIIWVVEHERDLPYWYTARSPRLRAIAVPPPHYGQRLAAAKRMVSILTTQSSDPAAVDSACAALSAQAAGMPLTAMRQIVGLAADQGLGLDGLDDAARCYRVGVTENPWRRPYLSQRLREEVSDPDNSQLARRVLGQDTAVNKSLDVLVRSVSGLSAAHSPGSAAKPRGVLFFAGPTGVGKTELAKALTKLLFDDERFYVRFDMSEFSSEQAAERMIGAPPGFIGHDAGGELTNAIRERPFSLILFDEIEKAHPHILDKFLQILDDGRLTDGRGETVYFTESVIVFTSNLGIYEEVQDPLTRATTRVPRVDSAMPYAQIAEIVGAAVRDHFALTIGRPELLNRIGDNIVVFDFIRHEVGKAILRGMLDNIIKRVRQEMSVNLTVSESIATILEGPCLSPEALQFGGRGIGARLETSFVDPLARAMFSAGLEEGVNVEVSALVEHDLRWRVELR